MISSTNVRHLFNDTVSKLLKDGEMFTAYDVTRLIRQQTKENVKYEEVRNELYTAYSAGQILDYYALPTKVGGANPLVYHPIGADHTQYDPDNFVGTAATVAAVPKFVYFTLQG